MAAGVLAVARGVPEQRGAPVELHQLRARHVHEQLRGEPGAPLAQLGSRTRGRPSLRRARAASPARRGARAHRAARAGPSSAAAEVATHGQNQLLGRRRLLGRHIHRGRQHRRVHAEPLADVRARELGVAQEALVGAERGRRPRHPEQPQQAPPWPGVRAVRELDHRHARRAAERGGTSLTIANSRSSSAERAVTSASIPATHRNEPAWTCTPSRSHAADPAARG